MNRNRDDFPKSTIEKLAKRVGYHCSNPQCRHATVGSKQNNNDPYIIGQAAHICAAAPGGPRYDSSMTSEQRKSQDNGIWLCSNCARMIDVDEDSYSVGLLREWKRNAEKWQNEQLTQKIVENLSNSQNTEDKPIYFFQKKDVSDSLFGVRATEQPFHATYLQSGLYSSFGAGIIEPDVPFDIEAERLKQSPEKKTNGYLYARGSAVPIEPVHVEIYMQASYTHYEILTEYYRFSIITSETIACGFRYEFCVEDPTVLGRRKAFDSMLEIAKCDALYVKLPNGDIVDFEVHMKMLNGRWSEVRKRLEMYIECMDRLLEIERHYTIIFTLPKKLTPEDINNLYTLSDSLNNKGCITLPGLPLDGNYTEEILFEEVKVIPFDNPISKSISLFGYVFSPCVYFFPIGTITFDPNRKLFCNCSEGLKIGCNFTCT